MKEQNVFLLVCGAIVAVAMMNGVTQTPKVVTAIETNISDADRSKGIDMLKASKPPPPPPSTPPPTTTVNADDASRRVSEKFLTARKQVCTDHTSNGFCNPLVDFTKRERMVSAVAAVMAGVHPVCDQKSMPDTGQLVDFIRIWGHQNDKAFMEDVKAKVVDDISGAGKIEGARQGLCLYANLVNISILEIQKLAE